MKSLGILRAILALNLVVTVAAMALAYRALHHADDSGTLVIRSHQALQAAEETLRRVVDAETWERAYLLTGTAVDLEAFQRARPLPGASLDNLAAMLREDGRGADAEGLRAQITSTLAAFDGLVERFRAGGGGDPAARADARAEMEGVRATIRSIRQKESDVLSARIQADVDAGRWVSWLAIVMTGFATALMTSLVAALVLLARPGIWRGR